MHFEQDTIFKWMALYHPRIHFSTLFVNEQHQGPIHCSCCPYLYVYVCLWHFIHFRCLQEVMSQRCVLAVTSFHTTTSQSNSNRCSVVRCSREKYERMYPVLLVRPDGSTINIRYKEPRRILMVSAVVDVS